MYLVTVAVVVAPFALTVVVVVVVARLEAVADVTVSAGNGAVIVAPTVTGVVVTTGAVETAWAVTPGCDQLAAWT